MHTTRPSLGLRCARGWSALALGTVLATGAAAQEGAIGTGGVSGTVRDSLGLPVEGAQITVSRSPLVGESDERGRFVLAKAAAGRMTVRVRRIGFRPDSVSLDVLAGRTIETNVTLGRLAVELSPVVVLGRRNITGRMAGFYQRQLRGGGHFITLDDINKRNPMNMTDMFRMIPGVRVETAGMRNRIRFRGGRCAPLTWLDGTPLYAGEFDLDAIDPRSLEGLEVYSGAASVPAEFQGNQSMSSACGTVVLWSRQGETRPKKPKKGELSAAAQIARMVEERTIFTAEQVESPARMDSSRIIHPVYPDSLFEHSVSGRLLAEFIVNQKGEVILDTFNVVTTSHPSLVEAVRRALREQQFHAARREGRPVNQVVQQPFDFMPDTSGPRPRRR